MNELNNESTTNTARLKILTDSLAKKKALFDQKINTHFDCVRSANGQPLNDKRNGAATLRQWDRQDAALSNLNQSIQKTEAAINREKEKIANVLAFNVPVCLRELLRDGVITQWRRHPRFFFVKGVDVARIVVTDNGTIAARYAAKIPTQEQYAVFRDVFNGAREIERREGRH